MCLTATRYTEPIAHISSRGTTKSAVLRHSLNPPPRSRGKFEHISSRSYSLTKTDVFFFFFQGIRVCIESRLHSLSNSSLVYSCSSASFPSLKLTPMEPALSHHFHTATEPHLPQAHALSDLTSVPSSLRRVLLFDILFGVSKTDCRFCAVFSCLMSKIPHLRLGRW